MLESNFVIQVVNKSTGEVVEWAPGRTVERRFITELVNRTVTLAVAKGLGVFRTEAHVKASIQEAIDKAVSELFHDLKSEVNPF